MSMRTTWRDYYELTKPRVVFLMLITAWVGMALASPGWIPMPPFIWGTLGIGLCAGSAAVVNQIVEQHLDKHMRRTQNRPVASGRVPTRSAVLFALIIGGIGFALLYLLVNPLTATLTLISQLAYALFYTLFLKHATPQNIVIGGAAGATPPLLGWTAITNHVDPHSLLLVLIIFAWTPPHFWALAIRRRQDYAAAGLPMLPVTHGVRFTQINILLYTILLILTTWLPFLTQMSHLTYFVGANILNLWFLIHTIRLYRTDSDAVAMKTFKVSIIYLMLLFVFLLVDHII